MLGPNNGANENQYLFKPFNTSYIALQYMLIFEVAHGITRRMELSPLLVVSWNMKQLSNLSCSAFGMACIASRTPYVATHLCIAYCISYMLRSLFSNCSTPQNHGQQNAIVTPIATQNCPSISIGICLSFQQLNDRNWGLEWEWPYMYINR